MRNWSQFPIITARGRGDFLGRGGRDGAVGGRCADEKAGSQCVGVHVSVDRMNEQRRRG